MFPFLPLLAAAFPLASAQETPTEPLPPAPTAPAAETAETAEPKKRKFLMEVGFRGRYMDLPDVLLDPFYYRNADSGDGIPDRPHIRAYSLGVEFVIKDKQANGIFYVEYMNPLIEAGYWDDVEQTPDHLDGSWMAPEKFGLVLIGANYAYELRATNWLSFLFGAGLGGAIKIGDLREWQPGECDPETQDCGTIDTSSNDNVDVSCGRAGTDESAAFVRKDICEDDGVVDNVPPAIPYLDVIIGTRFNIADRASIRVEGGIHMLLPYGGASVGIVF